MQEQDIKNLNYWEALSIAQKTEWNVNHAGWIIYQDNSVKYTLDTLNNGLSFRIGQWEHGKNVGKVINEISAPSEIEFLFSLSKNDEDEYE